MSKFPYYIEESSAFPGTWRLYGPDDVSMSSGPKSAVHLEKTRLNDAYRLGHRDALKGVKL